MKQLLLFFLAGVFYTASFAAVRLPKIFGNGMVLQRGQAIPVWGWADRGETVTVQFHNQKKTARAGKDGRWKVLLEPEEAGGPYTLTVSGKSKMVVGDVLVGDVWVCSGQSNMEWPVAASNNAAQEIAAANYPQIRHFKVTNSTAGTPLEDLMHAGSWKPATPENVGAFTAVGYFFARELYKQLGVPIGLLNTTWGGTDVETWTSREAFESNAEFKNMIAAVGHINLDSAAKARTQATLNKIKQFQPSLPDATALAQWPTPALNDAAWARMKLPALWEAGPLPDFDGVVWFRKTVEVSAENAGKPAELHLAMIDDADATYVNGVKVGSTNGYNEKRMYKIPAGVLKGGKNVIAVRVEDSGGGGGIYGDTADLKLALGGNAIPLSGDWGYGIESAGGGSGSTNPNAFPTLLYNAMIHPLIPYAMKGVIWYQGENNAGRAHQYRTAFPLMIQDWRKRWGRDFPFYFVQLASFNAGGGDSKKGSGWAELREAQTMTLKLPHTGMAVTTDIGEAGDIHPKNKQDVGLRLAAVALHDAYGKDNVFSGPVYQSMNVEGNKAMLRFSNTGGGLMARDKYGYLKGFEVAGADQQFYYAKAFVQGGSVVVYADEVKAPVAVRYAWADDAGDANLYNKEGFPAVPFRTDTWKGITEGAKYRNAR
jgi:sialate O-acetylesterase